MIFGVEYTLILLLQKDHISGESDDESDEDGQSDVSRPLCQKFFEPYVCAEYEWTLTN